MNQHKTLCAQLRGLEEELLDPIVRRNSERVNELLAENFEEIGSSGKAWSRSGIVELLAREDYTAPAMEDFQCRLISEGVALVTYRTLSASMESGETTTVLRSSIWILNAGRWRIRFHQGTRAS